MPEDGQTSPGKWLVKKTDGARASFSSPWSANGGGQLMGHLLLPHSLRVDQVHQPANIEYPVRQSKRVAPVTAISGLLAIVSHGEETPSRHDNLSVPLMALQHVARLRRQPR